MIPENTRFHVLFWLVMVIGLAACGTGPQVERVTVVPTQLGAGAPVYTATPSFTPSYTPTMTATYTPTDTPTATSTATATATPTATSTATPTPTATPSPTPELVTLTPPTNPQNVRTSPVPAPVSTAEGWSCGDFPCADDVEGFLERIQVPSGFQVTHAGRFPGQVQQIAFGPDGRLYATVLEDGTLNGAVYGFNNTGEIERLSPTLSQPLGLAFQPGTDILYVSGRINPDGPGALWRLEPDGELITVLDDLPCCFQEVGPQPSGLEFGPNGLLYMGIGAITDYTESSDPASRPFDEIGPLEAGILMIQPHTGSIERIAEGLRWPYDLAFDASGRLFATDSGVLTGPGDRIMRIEPGTAHGWPYYRIRGCAECPPTRGALDIVPDLLTLPNYTLPRGLIVYHGDQFPGQMWDTLFIALWNSVEGGQRIIWLNPRDPMPGTENYEPFAFMTGLIRPVDVAVSPDGALAVADYVYGHVWLVSYEG